MFRVWLPDDVICRINSIPPPHPNSGPDRVCWAQSTSGAFSVRSAYWTLKESSLNSNTWDLRELESFFGLPFSKDLSLTQSMSEVELVIILLTAFVDMRLRIWPMSFVIVLL
ncbi:hypothetical protein J1N35_014169 [Gossypium stocksii]|uniref:Uncharacterized protein n=1 Tax=Gossypium stocksii TaxID=47602 RepID=A0A9D4A7C9_9ROSI|nr:hypothetical protein J1N35_014169 [Gossypium stocksii]